VSFHCCSTHWNRSTQPLPRSDHNAVLPAKRWHDRFDFVFTERGPVGYDSRSIQAALSVLKTDGLLFYEAIGDLHHQQSDSLGPNIA
jgi:hypothetical protein